MFTTEEKMVNSCLEKLNTIFNIQDIQNEVVLEPTGLFGIPDIMIRTKQIISIEAKLKNWKRALIQAYKYRFFSIESYVFIDETYIENPLNNIEEFKKYNIGLAGVSTDNIIIYYQPEEVEPFSEELYNKAKHIFEEVK